MSQRFRIFISSPGDVNDERRRAALVIGRLKREFASFFDITPVLWEYEPMLSSGHFQDIIDPPADADILVLILWSRLGTPLPERTATREYRGIDGRAPVTGTEWEFESALAAREQRSGVPDLLVYRKQGEGFARFSRVDQLDQIRNQWESLQSFWQSHFEDASGQFKAAFNRFTTLLRPFARSGRPEVAKLRLGLGFVRSHGEGLEVGRNGAAGFLVGFSGDAAVRPDRGDGVRLGDIVFRSLPRHARGARLLRGAPWRSALSRGARGGDMRRRRAGPAWRSGPTARCDDEYCEVGSR